MQQRIQTLDQRLQLMELVNDANIDGIMVFDQDLNAVYWNVTSEVMTGIPKADAIGKHFYQLFPEFQNSKHIEEAVTLSLNGLKTFVPYEKCPDKDGYHERHFVPLTSHEAGDVLGVLCIVHDVAHRVKIEKELKSLNKSLVRKNKELKRTNAELAAFGKVTSRELKEPLHKIYSFAEMLQQKEGRVLSDDGKVYFKRIQASAQRMRLLTDDILAYCEIDTSRQKAGNVDMKHVMAFVLNNMQEELEQKKALVQTGDLPAVKGYRTLLVTLLENLVSNAIKFQDGRKVPTVAIEGETVPGDAIIHPDAAADTTYLRISVRDNGIGFDQKKAEQIFQMFYRLHPDKYTGSGIGLTICKKIAELHHGFITADSTAEGSTFNVFLPVS